MQFWNCTPFCKGKTGHPSNLRWIFLGLPPWVILSWFWCIIIIPVFLRFHFLLTNPPHSIADCPTNPIHHIDSTTSQLVSRSLSCQKFLGNFLTLGRGEFPVQIPSRFFLIPILSFIFPLHYHLLIGGGILWYIRFLWYGRSVCARCIIWCGRRGGSVRGGIRCLGIGRFSPLPLPLLLFPPLCTYGESSTRKPLW